MKESCYSSSLNRVAFQSTPWTAARQASLSITISRSLLKLMSIESMMNPTISSSVVPFSSCLQSFPASGSFPILFFFFLGNLGGGSEEKVTATATKPHEQLLCDSKSSSDGTHPQFYQKAQDLKAEIFWRCGRILCYMDQPAPWLMA